MNEEKDSWTHDGQVFNTGGEPYLLTPGLRTICISESDLPRDTQGIVLETAQSSSDRLTRKVRG